MTPEQQKMGWRDIESAPKDGSLLRLLVEYSENSTEDNSDPYAATIGTNAETLSGEDVWEIAGWDWCNDIFTRGEGKPVAWLPLLPDDGGFESWYNNPYTKAVFGSIKREYLPQDGQHEDDAAVDAFASEMKAKLAKKRLQGYSGWNKNTECSVERLSALLRDSFYKGDPIDIANFCMMLHARGVNDINTLVEDGFDTPSVPVSDRDLKVVFTTSTGEKYTKDIVKSDAINIFSRDQK